MPNRCRLWKQLDSNVVRHRAYLRAIDLWARSIVARSCVQWRSIFLRPGLEGRGAGHAGLGGAGGRPAIENLNAIWFRGRIYLQGSSLAWFAIEMASRHRVSGAFDGYRVGNV